MNPGLALFKALVPGGVEGGRRGGQQRLLTKTAKGHLPRECKGAPPVAGVSVLPWQSLGCRNLGGPLVGVLGAPQAWHQVCPRLTAPQALAAGPLGPRALLHPCSSHMGSSFLAQGFLVYMLLSSWSPPHLDFTFEGIKRIHKVVQASPLCNSELDSHPKRRTLGTVPPSSRSPRHASHFLRACMCLWWTFRLHGVTQHVAFRFWLVSLSTVSARSVQH